jgi:alkanesulfonate monooxygenase SsuD/methylene tetrahydromethanopterin reductase-like flavin-dependent oxidoreductase (luciferase family)
MTVKRQHHQIWTLVASTGTDHPSPKYWINLAQLAESAKLHSLIILDLLVEPSVYISAIGDATKSIGLAIAYTTDGEHPYLQARKFASLDEFTNGRFGWVNTRHHKYSDEYLEVFTELLMSSWRDDALVKNKETGEWVNTDRLRQIDYEGPTFKVPGPGLTKPSPQRLPVIISLDTTSDGARRHAAKFAEVISIYGDKKAVSKTVKSLKNLAANEFGRDPQSIKFLAQVFVVVGETHEAAERKYIEGSAPISGFTVIIGTPTEVADELQEWFNYSDIDGFNFHTFNLKDLSNLLIPELQDRGVAQTEYSTANGTLRENLAGVKGDSYLAPDHPFYHYRWFANLSQDEFETVLSQAKQRVASTETGYA